MSAALLMPVDKTGNPYHDEKGLFASGPGSAAPTQTEMFQAKPSESTSSQEDRIKAVLQAHDSDPEALAAKAKIDARGDVRKDAGVMEGGHYSAWADKENESIALSFLNPAAIAKPGEAPTATFIMGLPGSGKTSVKNSQVKIPPSVDVNSDLIQEKIPGYEPQLANAYHYRAADIVRTYLMPAAINGRYNIMVDTTDNKDRLMNQIGMAKDMGYKVGVIHVHVDNATSMERVYTRFKSGDRYVAPRTALEYGSRPAEAFEAVKPLVDQWREYDTTGSSPRKTSEGGGGVFE